ncbi:E3 ubiquitin-protein ligase rnf146 isoform X10 [Drosophila rhopaloa]|uniref:E3 ubiquitin-protein ligase n=1 Tax=Drosophila rhopaloa TaxID=1041015 RepID=A0ABM5J541_DRORH|nr:E3 ubiquitin-protein ligase rnf146 isoform X10 [Drosophila rhopaloa]
MSQQRATDQGAATNSSNNNSDVITLGDIDEDGDVIFVGIVRPTVTTVDLCLSPSTSAAAAAAARSGNGSADEPDTELGLGSRATASASNPISPASSPEDAAKPGTVDAATTISDGDSFSATAVALECPICLQTCIHPARLPCGHIFCFLCVKGVAYKNPRCAMCRREIPAEFLDHPQLVNGIEDICTTRATEDGYQWYYEGRNGWWQYDDRTSQDIEEAFKKGDKSCTILVAGYVYIVDLEQLVQQRQNEPTRCRRVKRDLATIPKKGVAGLRIEGNQVTSDTIFSRPPTTANPTTVAAAASSFISTIAATDAAIRIASDIIGSTLAHADELTRGLAASNISDDPSSSNSFSICTPPLLLTAKCVFVASLISTIYLTLY